VIETEQVIAIAAPIGRAWDYARDIGRWADLMPGLQAFEIVDADDSRWTLKVGVGALVRTVHVLVHVERWAGPGQVDFSFTLDRDPVRGGGRYTARSLGANETEVTLAVRVEGTGPMAPMWEAMGKPLLPKFAHAFAEQFKAEVERAARASAEAVLPADGASVRPESFAARLMAWFRSLIGARSKAETTGENMR
jgi:carbon monoxide dehydrogenase subunit G